MSIFSRLIRKYKEKNGRKVRREFMDVPENDDAVDEVLLSEPISIRNHVISLCEQMIDISRELDDVRREYDRVTAYLNDIQIVEGLAGEQRKQLEDVATQLSKLTSVRNSYLNAEHKISDETFKQMEEMEAEIPDIIRRLKVNEADLETVRHDLNYLASQKVEWSVIKHEREEELEQLRKLSFFLLFGFGGIAVLVAILSITLEWEFLPLFIVALFATLAASYVILRIQECNKDIKQSEVNQNYIISLENRIKIKYVNAKNAVDYTCKRFHVINSQVLTYHYEQYIEICKEREKFKQTNEDLEYMKNRLVRILRSMNLYDARIWLNYTDAIVNTNEMVELKHELFERRKFLRSRIDYNLNAISKMRSDVSVYVDRMGDKSVQVRAIINKVDELNKGLGLL